MKSKSEYILADGIALRYIDSSHFPFLHVRCTKATLTSRNMRSSYYKGSCHFIPQGMGYTVTVGLGAETERKTNGKSPWDKIGDSLWWSQGREDRSTVSNGIKWITTMKEICTLTGKMQCFQVFNKSICWIHECRLISLIAIDYQPISQSVSTSALTTLSTPDTLRKLHGKYSRLLSKWQKQQQLKVWC